MRWPAVFAVLAVLAGCGENAASAPFDGLPLDGDVTVGVDAPVHAARDRHGIAHILAGSLADAAFVQGRVTAHGRLPQVDVLFVLPGDGTGDSVAGATPSPRYIPHAVDSAQGTLIPTNADPVGATFDGRPLDQATADGAPRYAGVAYAAGLGADRLPGGAIQDRRSPHGRDLLDRFYPTDPRVDAPSSIDDIVAAGESRWVFH